MSTNNITGDNIITPPPTDAYRDNYERIFIKPEVGLEDINDEEKPRSGIVEETNTSS